MVVVLAVSSSDLDVAWPFGDLPRRQFKAIVADPPWHFRCRTSLTKSNWTSRKDAEKHYGVMGFEDIKALPVRELAAPDAHLFIWVTGPMLDRFPEVMAAWGFRFSSDAFVWVKQRRGFDAHQLRLIPRADVDLHLGTGFTTRKNAEYVMLGRRGNAKRLARDVRQIIEAPVREHSRKPNELFARVERYCEGPYLELFARERRAGWAAWGNQVDLFGSEGAA